MDSIYEQILDVSKEHLKDLLNRTGSILYSSFHTLKKGEYYLVGINPGGSGGQTVGEHIEQLPKQESNAYNEQWERGRSGKLYGPGQHPLQKRLRSIFRELGVELDDVCASNIVFFKSREVKELNNINDLAEDCWPVHQVILKVVRPKYILTFGALPFSIFSQELKFVSLQPTDSGHGNWVIRTARSEDGQQFLVGLPHLSRYSPPRGKIRDVIKNLKQPDY